MHVAILRPQVPFIVGGAEYLADSLKEQLDKFSLNGARIYAEVVTVPFLWYPPMELINQITLWKLLNLKEVNGEAIDLVIPLKFPSYFVDHPRVRPWLLHQHRQAYDLYDTPFGDLHQTVEGREVAAIIREMDSRRLGELPVRVISRTVQDRLAAYNGVASKVLYPPPPRMEDYRPARGFERFVLVPGRIDTIKRQDLIIRAVRTVPDIDLVIIGEGAQQTSWQQLAVEMGVGDRVKWLGRVSQQTKVDLYQRCMAVFNAPYDEDYGFVTVEAFLSQKPVITTNDSGGVLEFVRHGETGWVVEPTEQHVASALQELVDGGESLQSHRGQAALDFVKSLDIGWDAVKKELLA